MKMVKIAEAKNQLSRHIAYVRAGGRVRIFDRDTPVADLVPIAAEEPSSADDEELLASLERRGLVRRGTGRLPREVFSAGAAKERGARVLDALLDERRGSR